MTFIQTQFTYCNATTFQQVKKKSSKSSIHPSLPQVMEELSVNTSSDSDLTLLQQLTQAVLHTVEAGGLNLLTSSDVLYLTQMIEMDLSALASTHSAGANAAEIMVSIATNYVKVASLMLEPHMATQWMGLTEDGVRE